MLNAVLLCAGRGSRLDPLTRDRPKCLVEVAGKTILQHQIDALAANGIRRIAVVGGYRFDALQAHCGTLHAPVTLDLVYNPFWSVASSIGSVWTARDRLNGPFCLMNGDTIVDRALIGEALGAMMPCLNLVAEEVRDPAPDDMRIAAEDGRIFAVGKNLPPDIARLRSLGIVLCPESDGGDYPSALMATISDDDGPHLYHHDIIDRMAQDRAIHALIPRHGLWQEVDCVEDVLSYERRVGYGVLAGAC